MKTDFSIKNNSLKNINKLNIIKSKLVLGFFLILSVFFKVEILNAETLNTESIKNYEVTITINKNATLNVNEKIDYYFPEEKHGIYRDIPLRSKENGVDVYKSFIKMNYITRNGNAEPYNMERFSQGNRYKVGSASEYVKVGINTYEFDYTIYNAVFEKDGIYQVYFNAIGQFWNVPIEKSKITIKYANGAEITNNEIQKIEVYTGGYGDSSDNYITTEQNGEIIINTKETLNPYNGLTFLLNLKTDKINQTWLDKLTILFYASPVIIFAPLIILGLLIYSFITWSLFGRDPSKKAIIPEFNEPKDMSAMFSAYINGTRDPKELITVGILSLLSKGFINAEDNDGNGKNVKYTVTSLADNKEQVSILHEEEKELLQTLSANRKDLFSNGVKMYNVGQDIFEILEEKYNDVIYKKNRGFDIAYIIAIVLIAFSNISVAAFIINGISSLPAIAFFIIIAIFLSSLTSIGEIKLFPIMVILSFFVAMASGFDIFFIIPLVIILIMSLIYSKLIGKYTNVGIRKKEYLQGMKMYIKTAEENQIKKFNDVDELVAFFKKILPYAVALGVTNEAIKLMKKSIKMYNFEEQENYINSRVYMPSYSNHYLMQNVFNSYNTGQQTIIERNSRNNSGGGFSSGRGGFGGGGFSGGGFSGGGSGGGGGGSW